MGRMKPETYNIFFIWNIGYIKSLPSLFQSLFCGMWLAQMYIYKLPSPHTEPFMIHKGQMSSWLMHPLAFVTELLCLHLTLTLPHSHSNLIPSLTTTKIHREATHSFLCFNYQNLFFTKERTEMACNCRRHKLQGEECVALFIFAALVILSISHCLFDNHVEDGIQLATSYEI